MTKLSSQLPAIARCLPFCIFITALAIRGALDGHTDTRWLYPLQAGASALALVVLWHHYGELRDDRRAAVRFRHAALSVGVGLAVFALWVSLTEPWMRMGEPAASFVPVQADGELQWGLIGLRLAGAVLVVPLMEELFWRSFLMRWIDRRDFLSVSPRQASLYALLASSAVFALAHDLWLAGFIAGLAFGALYRYTGQIWHAVTAHLVANLALGVWVIHQRAWGFW
ncbi:MAG: CAAX prenyl protease-related protein [Rhizobacter sp.]